MAKLSAHGRKELHRLSRPEDDGESVMAIMSDRTVLMKFVSIKDGRRKSSTWKKAGRIKPGHIESYMAKVKAKLGYA